MPTFTSGAIEETLALRFAPETSPTASTLPVEETVAPVTEPVVFIFAPETSPTATTLPVEETVAPVIEPVVMIAPDAEIPATPLIDLPSLSTVI